MTSIINTSLHVYLSRTSHHQFLETFTSFPRGVPTLYVQMTTCNKQRLLYPCSCSMFVYSEILKCYILHFTSRWFYILYQQLKAELAPKAGTPYIDGERCLLCQKERYERGKKGQNADSLSICCFTLIHPHFIRYFHIKNENYHLEPRLLSSP